MILPALLLQKRPQLVMAVEPLPVPQAVLAEPLTEVGLGPQGYTVFNRRHGYLSPDRGWVKFPRTDLNPSPKPQMASLTEDKIIQSPDGYSGELVWTPSTSKLDVYPHLSTFNGNPLSTLDVDGVPVGALSVGKTPDRRKVPAVGLHPLPLPKGFNWNGDYPPIVTSRRGRIYATGVNGKVLVWRSRTQLPQILPLPPGAVSAEIRAVNPDGTVAGVVRDAKRRPSAVVWRGGKPRPLPGRPLDDKHPMVFWTWGILDGGLLIGSWGETFSYGSELWATDGERLLPYYNFDLRAPDGTRIWAVPSSRVQVAPDGDSFITFLEAGTFAGADGKRLQPERRDTWARLRPLRVVEQ